MIKLKNVSFAYSKDSANILKNINLEINDGECVAFIGAVVVVKLPLQDL